MKTPEEIKKGILCESCNDCPYKGRIMSDGGCAQAVNDDVLDYIEQLEILAKLNEQIRWERDVAIDQLRQLGIGFGEKVEAPKEG